MWSVDISGWMSLYIAYNGCIIIISLFIVYVCVLQMTVCQLMSCLVVCVTLCTLRADMWRRHVVVQVTGPRTQGKPIGALALAKRRLSVHCVHHEQ